MSNLIPDNKMYVDNVGKVVIPGDLSVEGELHVAGLPSASGPLGAVQLSDGSGNLTNDPMLVWRDSDNTLRLGVDGEGVAISITATSGGYLYFADENVTGSFQRLVGGAAQDFLIKNQLGGFDIDMESEQSITLLTEGVLHTFSDDSVSLGAGAMLLDTPNSQLQLHDLTDVGCGLSLNSDDSANLYFNHTNGDTISRFQCGTDVSDNLKCFNTNDFHVITSAGASNYLTRFGSDGTLHLPNGMYLDDASDGQFVLSSTFTNLYIGASSGIELIPASGGVFISHSTGGADTCAAMHFETSGQGVILPRMNETVRDGIASPSQGLIIYNTDTNVLNFYNGSVWGAV